MAASETQTYQDLPSALKALARARGQMVIIINTPDDPIFTRVPKSTVRDWWTQGWCPDYLLTLQRLITGETLCGIETRY